VVQGLKCQVFAGVFIGFSSQEMGQKSMVPLENVDSQRAQP
jgi:hypothetical protein